MKNYLDKINRKDFNSLIITNRTSYKDLFDNQSIISNTNNLVNKNKKLILIKNIDIIQEDNTYKSYKSNYFKEKQLISKSLKRFKTNYKTSNFNNNNNNNIDSNIHKISYDSKRFKDMNLNNNHKYKFLHLNKYVNRLKDKSESSSKYSYCSNNNILKNKYKPDEDLRCSISKDIDINKNINIKKNKIKKNNSKNINILNNTEYIDLTK